MNKLQNNQKAYLYGRENPDFIKDECLFEVFENTVAAYPNNKAIIFEDESITYNELNILANKIAAMLISSGVRKDDRIALFMPKSIECYASIIGIMKAGACYIPLDIGYPEDRVKYIVEDSGARYILSLEGSRTIDSISNEICLNRKLLESYSGLNISRNETGVKRECLAYIIYTSGSTGRPKGVMIEHKSACNLIRASQEIYQVTPCDRVYQGFTLAFDASVEELWMGFLNGAALVPQTDKMKKSGPDLFKILAKYDVSIISCVPTLLSMISDDLKTLKLLILGGEACPESIVERFKKDGRRILNTYGPTEATVICTWSQMEPGQKVTIGKPLTNYSAYVVNENNELADIDEPGELLIGGIGLARGYIGREDLNQEKFVKNVYHVDKDKINVIHERLYRSGDLVIMDTEGNLEFHGRIDDQVKIRGFRVELSEIENVANSFPSVKSSVVKVHRFDDSNEALCLYAMPSNQDETINVEGLFEVLRERLPAYMIPQHFMQLEEIPMLPSGKADRKQLPEPLGNTVSSNRDVVEPVNEEEKILSDVFKQVFKLNNISTTDHFFNDLGGHSLYAAQTVSNLRKITGFEGMNISDLYDSPTIKELAAKYRNNKKDKQKVKDEPAKPFLHASSLKHFICGFFQALSIVMLTFLIMIPVGYLILNVLDYSFSAGKAISIVAIYGLAYGPVTLMLSVLSKWVIIGKYKEGSYPLWGLYYFRWWLARLLQGMFPAHFICGTPFMSRYLRLMGAKVGKDCFIATQLFGVFDLVSIGDNTSISQDSQLLGYSVENGYLNIGRITIGEGCYIGTHSYLCIGSEMENGSMIKEQSMIPSGCTIPAGETWEGSPVRFSSKDNDLDVLAFADNKVSKLRKFGISCLHLIMLMGLGLFSALMLCQGFACGYFYFTTPSWMVIISPITSTFIVLVVIAEIIIFKRLLMNKLEPGVYSIYSVTYVRKWAADNIMNFSLQMLHTLYATLYTIPFLKALGAKIGKKVEISTVMHISPELFEVGDGSFFADASMAGTPKAYNNHIMYEKIKVGSRTFIGNSAIVPINSTIGDDCLIGVMSIPPNHSKTENGTSWLGTPAMFLHKRDINDSFDSEETYNPGKKLYLKRLIIEFIRVILPTNIYVILSYALVYLFYEISVNNDFWPAIFMFTASAVVSEALLILFVVLLKFSLMATYRPCINPLWSSFVWKTEFVTGVYENLLGDHILTPLAGTPLLPIVMRLFGCRIGKKVFLDTIFISEFDLVRIGHEAAVNFNSTMQTHLFEDRVLKMDYLTIGKMASVGNGAVVLYDTHMEEGSKLGSSSLLMKGEILSANTHWHGTPSILAV